MLIKSLTLTVCALTLTACAYWPPEGQGGQAESFETEPAYWSELRQNNKRLIECFDRTIQGLASSSYQQRHPAKLKELSIDWTRAIRAHSAHMDLEAQNDLITLAQKFRQFHKILQRQGHFQLISNATTSQETCS